MEVEEFSIVMFYFYGCYDCGVLEFAEVYACVVLSFWDGLFEVCV